MQTDAPADVPLEVTRRPRAGLALGTVTVAAVAGATFWFLTNPPDLATGDAALTASTPTGQDVYLRVYRAADDRTLQVSGVRVHVRSDTPVDVEPLLCRGGPPQVTTNAAAFCTELVVPDGRTLAGGDSVLLRVRGEDAADVSIDRIRIAYRDGIRRGTQQAGVPARVNVLAR